MSVLIKDMKMPNTCEECNLESFCDRWIDARKMCGEWKSGVKATIRYPECPLVELPPHGRLIEESKVLDIVSEWCPDDDGSVGKDGDLREMLDEIEALPTIIPASDKDINVLGKEESE